MATSAPARCRRLSDFPEPALNTDMSEYFSPDILRVFRDDRDSDVRPILSGAVVDTAFSHSSGPSRFPQFQLLPLELRWMVWEAALSEPTVVPRTWSNSQFRYRLQRKVPNVLHVCSEARRLLIARKQEFSSSSAPRVRLVQPRESITEGVYINWRTDSLWIYRGYSIGEAEIAAYADMERLVMNWGLRPCWVDSMVNEGVKFIQQFPKLALLTLLVDFSEHGWPEPSTLKGLKRLKRNEVKRIWALVQKAFAQAREAHPGWSPPALHIVHRTANWSRKEAK